MDRKNGNPSLFIGLHVLPLVGLLWIGLLILSGCGIPPSETPSAIATYPASVTPTQLPLSPTSTPFPHRILVFPEQGATHTPTATRTPTKTRPPTSTPTTTPTPFPTPVTIQPNAIAFIASRGQSKSGPDSLWVANVDGSGAKQILDKFPIEDVWGLQWSPDGKWLSYVYKNELWIVEPTGENQQKLLERDPEKGGIIGYAWSPDRSRIVFSQGYSLEEPYTDSIWVIELESNKVKHLTEVPSSGGTWFLWSADAQYLALRYHVWDIMVIDSESGETVSSQTSDISCGGFLTNMEWSPDGKWLLHLHIGNGRYGHLSACMTNLSGETIMIRPEDDSYANIGNAIWGKDGQSIYLSVRNYSPDDPTIELDPRLLRFDVQHHTFERVLSLGLEPYTRLSLLSSPNKQFLSNITSDGTESFSFELISIPDFQKRILPILGPIYSQAWSTDNLHYVFFVGQKITSMGGDPDFGIFYSMDINTGQVFPLTGEHLVKAWVISPVVNFWSLP